MLMFDCLVPGWWTGFGRLAGEGVSWRVGFEVPKDLSHFQLVLSVSYLLFKIETLSYFCLYTFAPLSRTLTLWNHEPNSMLSLLSFFGHRVLSQHSKVTYTRAK